MKNILFSLLIFLTVTVICKDGSVYKLDDEYMVTDSSYWLGGDEPLLLIKLKDGLEYNKKVTIPISKISKIYKN